jgi:hypothetical protein
MFQLKTRMERTQTRDSLHHNDFSDEPSIVELQPTLGGHHTSVALDAAAAQAALSQLCADKAASGNRPLRACFGRRRTHNEELCVASCGVILGRVTMYGSEAPNGVRVSVSTVSCICITHA